MTIVLENFIEDSSKSVSTSELLVLYLRIIDEAGYQNAVYLRSKEHRVSSMAWNRLPEPYLEKYSNSGWSKIDPIVQHACVACQPFRWTDLAEHINLTKQQKLFLGACRELGVHSGITFPFHGLGAEVDIISLSLRGRTSLADDRLFLLHAVSAQYWVKFRELNDASNTREIPNLTDREVECLKWCKEGKTNWEIGEIVSTSEKTVEFHLSNVIRKLGACNRMTAVVTALQAGIIVL